jgi:predicted dithiol-disulfide oxidoreductase (DUF899 family)
MHEIRLPNESPEYRRARDELLTEELALRRQIERVAEQRRRLPLGGVVAKDYVFGEAVAADEGIDAAGTVRMSELFQTGLDTLVIYSFMYGPDAARPCPMCTSILDSLDGAAEHVSQRANLVVVAKSPIDRIRAFARERGWHRLRLLSSAGNTYNRDYHAETLDGKQLPAMNVFVRRGGRIHHFWSAELLYMPSDPGQEGRHADMIWPLWNVLDVTPEGRGTFHPRLTYEKLLLH